ARNAIADNPVAACGRTASDRCATMLLRAVWPERLARPRATMPERQLQCARLAGSHLSAAAERDPGCTDKTCPARDHRSVSTRNAVRQLSPSTCAARSSRVRELRCRDVALWFDQRLYRSEPAPGQGSRARPK